MEYFLAGNKSYLSHINVAESQIFNSKLKKQDAVSSICYNKKYIYHG